MEEKNITVSQLVDFAEDADERMDALEERGRPVLFTIPVDGWETDSTVPKFPFCCDIAVTGLSARDVVCVDVVPVCANIARAADFTTVESFDGKFRLRAKRIPAQAIQAQYRVVARTAEKEV